MGKLCLEPVPGSLLPVILLQGWSEAEGDPHGWKGEKAYSRRLGTPPPGGPSRQPGTAALSSRMPSHASKKTVDPQAREISHPVGQRREGQGELGPFDDRLCHPSVSPAPPRPLIQPTAEPMAVERTQGFSQLSPPRKTRQEETEATQVPRSLPLHQRLTGSLPAPSASAANAFVNRSLKRVPQAGYIQLPQSRLCGVL